jgi:hypothetical protein
MYRFILTLLALSITLGMSASTVYAGSSVAHPSWPRSLRDDLTERVRLSRIEVQDLSDQGAVILKGTVLRLQADGIPANQLRSFQLNPKSPRRYHVADYARVEIGRDGRITADPGAVSLSKGTELVVLDLKVSGDQVRLFTHTLDRVPLPGGKVGHGCTEFVFAFDPGTLNRANLGAIAGRIDAVLTRNSNG